MLSAISMLRVVIEGNYNISVKQLSTDYWHVLIYIWKIGMQLCQMHKKHLMQLIFPLLHMAMIAIKLYIVVRHLILKVCLHLPLQLARTGQLIQVVHYGAATTIAQARNFRLYMVKMTAVQAFLHGIANRLQKFLYSKVANFLTFHQVTLHMRHIIS